MYRVYWQCEICRNHFQALCCIQISIVKECSCTKKFLNNHFFSFFLILFTLKYVIHMNIFLMMEVIPTKYAAFVLVMLATFTESKITKLNVEEGDVASLNFSYSCNSTKVTLQVSNAAPFYNSRSPTPLSSSYLKLRNGTDGKVCFLYLTIDPVTRDDAGGYILTAYNNGPMLFEDDRVLLLVSYPPGKASCSLGEEYIDPDWVRLQCTAPIGTIGGYIMCYQNGIKIPPLNSPQVHDEILSQTLLAKVGDLVYCCSSTLDQTIDRCECKDSVWDPTQNKEITDITDPCPTAEIPHPAFSQHPIKDIELESTSHTNSITKAPTSSTITFQQVTSSKVENVLIVVVCFLILVNIVSIAGALCCFKRHPKKQANDKVVNGEQKLFIAELQRI